MRKTMMFLMIFTGTIFTVFIFNLLMYAFWPQYHDAISAAVESSEDSEIPIVTPEMVKELPPAPEGTDEVTPVQSFVDEEIALSPEAMTEVLEEEPEAPKPEIVDKQYHEDCGTGKGYWVITYSDGTTVIE